MEEGTLHPDGGSAGTNGASVSMLGPTHLFGSLCFYGFGLVYLGLLDSPYMFASNWVFGTLCAVSWFALRGRAPQAVRASVFIAVVYLGLVNVGVHVGGRPVPMVFWGLSIAVAATFVHELRGVLVWAVLSAGFYPLTAFLRSGPLAAHVVPTTPGQDVVLAGATYAGLLSCITFSFALFRTKLTDRSNRLRNSEERWQFALEGNGDGVWDWDPKTGVAFFSRRWKEMLGYSEEEVGSRVEEWDRRVHPDDRAVASEAVGLCLSGKAAVYEVEHRVQCRDGDYKWILARGIVAERDPDGSPRRMIGTHSDVTRRKRVEEELREAKERAEAASLAKSTFLASMSHEIRTPMNTVLGFSQLLLASQDLMPQQKEQVQAIYKGGEHLLGLIDDILEMSKIEAGRVSLNIGETDLGALLSDLEEMVRLRAREKGLTFEVGKAAELPGHVVTDEGKLRQILVNLAGNAVKFTSEGGVTVRVRTEPGARRQLRLVVEVEDTGPGISEEDLPRLFQRFEQTRTGRAATGGTGLGLAISRGFAQLMGGEITVRSRAGAGSVFRLDIPVVPAVSSEAPARSPSRRVVGLAPGETRRRILVADDVAESGLILRLMLERAGFEVRTVVDGAKALEELHAWHPDLVFMDLRMPGMDGLEAMRAIRSVGTGVRVALVAVTASAFVEDRIEVQRAGGDAFVSKPFREAELFEAISRCLGTRFVYEGEETEVARQEPQLPEASPIPDLLRESLLRALTSGDYEAILELSDELGRSDAVKGRVVRDLAGRFAYERLGAYLRACA